MTPTPLQITLRSSPQESSQTMTKKLRREFAYKPSTRILLCLVICELGTIQIAYRRIPNEEKVLSPGRYVVWSCLLFIVWPCGFWGVTLLGRLILNLSLTGVNIRGEAMQERIKEVRECMHGSFHSTPLHSHLHIHFEGLSKDDA